MAAVEKTKKQQKKVGQATWFSRHFPVLIVLAFTFLLYVNMLGNGYNMDDELVTMNHRLTSQGISAIPEIFTSPYYQDNMGYAYDYRPLVLTSFAIEHQFFGESPLVGHLVSLLIYISLCLLLYKTLVRLGYPITPMLALFITLLFSAHVAHTEVVCSIKNRDELLAFLFGLLATHTLFSKNFGKYDWRLFLVPVYFLLAMLSKSTFVTFVVILPLVAIFFTSISLSRVALLTFLLAVVTISLTEIKTSESRFLILLGFVFFNLIIYLLFRRSLPNIKLLNENKDVVESTTIVELRKDWIYILANVTILVFLHLSKVFIVPDNQPVVFFIIGLFVFTIIVRLIQPKIWNAPSFVLVGLVVCLTQYNVASHQPDWGYFIEVSVVCIALWYMFFSDWVSRIAASCILVYTIFYVGLERIQAGEIIGYAVFFLLTYFKQGKTILKILFFLVFFSFVMICGDMIFKGKYDDISPIISTLFIGTYLISQGKSILYLKKYGHYFFILIVLVLQIVFYASDFERLDETGNRYLESLNMKPNFIEDRSLSYIEYPLPPGTKESIRQGTALVVMGHYFQKVILPYPLSFYYGYSFIEPTEVSNVNALWSLVVHLVLLLAALYFVRTKPLVSFALFIYLSTVALSSGYFMSVPGIVADRYLFVSSLGWCMLLGYGLFYLVERYLAKKTITDWSSVSTPVRILALLPLVIYSSLTFSRNFHWKDHLTLMRKDVQYVTNSAQAHNLLALNIMKSTTEGQKTQAELDALRQEALGHFKQSFAIYPNTFNVAYDIGRVYSAMNNPDSMMVYFQKATDLDPDHQLPELSYTLAVYHQETKKYDYAIIQLQKLLKLQNTNLEAYSRLSYIHFTLGQYDQALATNRTAAFNLPTRPEPFINMAYTFQGMKNLDSMKYYFNLAEQRFPGHPVVLQAKRNLNNQ